MKKVVLFFVLVFSVCAYAQEFPRPKGHVNDFANVIADTDEKVLEEKLVKYRADTSIEIAFASVPSLAGMEASEYANKLFAAWGVGAKGKDNGLLILLAPNEREIQIEVGYGLEADLPDGRVGQILDEFAVPSLKQNNWTQGAGATIDGIIAHLGSKPYDERIAERAQKKEAERQAQIAFLRDLSAFAIIAIPFAILIAFLLTWRWNKNEKKRLRSRIGEVLDQSRTLLAKYRLQMPDVQENIASFETASDPDDFIKQVGKRFLAHPAALDEAEAKINRFQVTDSDNRQKLESASDAATRILAACKLLDPTEFANEIGARIKQRKRAQDATLEFMQEAPAEIEKLKALKLTNERSAWLLRVERMYADLAARPFPAETDWLSVYAQVAEIQALMAKITERERPVETVRRSTHTSSPSYRSPSSSSSSSYRPSGGGFGGFGGGRSGGGGAGRGF